MIAGWLYFSHSLQSALTEVSRNNPAPAAVDFIRNRRFAAGRVLGDVGINTRGLSITMPVAINHRVSTTRGSEARS